MTEDIDTDRGTTAAAILSQACIVTAHLSFRGDIPGLRAHSLEFKFVARFLGKLVQKFLGRPAIALAPLSTRQRQRLVRLPGTIRARRR